MKKPIVLTVEEDVKKLTVPNDLNSHITTHAYLYLQPHGWFNEFPVDEEGLTPWYTFPAITFLKDIISNQFNVLEYGSGYSTLFYKPRVRNIITIEHDQVWADKVLAENNNLDIRVITENSEVHPEALSVLDNFKHTYPQVRSQDYQHDLKHGLVNDEFAGYASIIYQAYPNFYDMIVIDGMARALCTVMAVESGRLKDDGIIILDNSDRWQYNSIQQYLHDKGYGRLDFWGPGWNNYNSWCTSFYSKNFKLNNNRLLRAETGEFIVT